MSSYEIIWTVAITFEKGGPKAKYTLASLNVPPDSAVCDEDTGSVLIKSKSFDPQDNLKMEYQRSGTNFSFKSFKFDQKKGNNDADGTKTFTDRGTPPHKIHFKNKRNTGSWKLSYDIKETATGKEYSIDPEIENTDTVILTPKAQAQP